ncbi:MAG: hypothetical protein COV07_04600 [Candidatus Vogelbacteria bacterium CG10_big_fil_rev_8_21_14_0_10_45_14]|uniref:DUF5667 domain-containing protein n=1 Tax=Candidatus Vogelbacteria bacterium CG10_big_fil_rev_8_21_14_0_10_45_14 TaxID=1975042 RepID=A0A2H0RID4_9BACT|nr:MAG: hypothetical protein COV07_04600 [Candidatus Vogelbacteria bacterium CG10_big_fil_rev_8_21_14_0_10_45_14]
MKRFNQISNHIKLSKTERHTMREELVALMKHSPPVILQEKSASKSHWLLLGIFFPNEVVGRELQDIGKSVSLFQSEKDAMLHELKGLMRESPSHVTSDSHSAERVREAMPSGSFIWGSFLSPMRLVPIALSFLLFFGTGIAFAAERSLPGSVLYPIKIRVNEEVRLSVARTPERVATVAISLASERLKEAEILATENRLSRDLEEELSVAFVQYTNLARAQVAEMKREEKQIAVAAKLAGDIETTLSAHDVVIGELENGRLAVLSDVVGRELDFVVIDRTSAEAGVSLQVVMAEDDADNRRANEKPATEKSESVTMMSTQENGEGIALSAPSELPNKNYEVIKMEAAPMEVASGSSSRRNSVADISANATLSNTRRNAEVMTKVADIKKDIVRLSLRPKASTERNSNATVDNEASEAGSGAEKIATSTDGIATTTEQYGSLATSTSMNVDSEDDSISSLELPI